MCDRRLASVLAVLALAAGCKSKDDSKPAPAAAKPAVGSAAPAPAPSPDPACLTATTIQANHPPPGAGPCTQDTAKDLNRDGLVELVVWCGADEASSSTIYVQGPADCFTKVGELDARWVLLDGEAPVNGFAPLAVIVHEGDGDGEIEEVTYVYDPASRSYREQAEVEAAAVAPAAAALELPKDVLGLAEIAGIAVGEPGFKGAMPTCCLDCDPMVPALRRLEVLAAGLRGPVGPAPLRAAAAHLRETPWDEIVEETYSAKARKAFVGGLAALATALDVTADALDTGDATAAARADDLGRAATKALAAARALGAESQHYCGGD